MLTWLVSSLKPHLLRGLWLCHTHALTSLHRVPIAKLMHMLVAQTAAGVVCGFLFLPVPMWAASVFTSGDRHPLTSKYGGQDGRTGPVRNFIAFCL